MRVYSVHLIDFKPLKSAHRLFSKRKRKEFEYAGALRECCGKRYIMADKFTGIAYNFKE